VEHCITGESIQESPFRKYNSHGPTFAREYVFNYESMLKPRLHICHRECVSDIIQSQDSWLMRVIKSPAMRALRARIDLRNKIEREPSASEVQAHMCHKFTDQITYKEVSAAFRSGKEVRQTFGFLHD
jgi:hypothetical protein